MAVRSNIATGSTGNVTVTHIAPTPLDANYGHVAIVQRLTATQPATPAGWDLLPIGTGSNVSSSTAVWAYTKQGDGVTNSFTVASGSVTTRALLLSYPLYTYTNFATAQYTASPGTVVATLASGTLVTTEANMMGVSFVAMNSTISAPSFSNSYVTGGSSTSGYVWGDRNIQSAANSNAATTASWTTSRNAAMVTIILRVSPAFTGSVGLSGSGTLTGAGLPHIPGTRAFTGSGALTTSGRPKLTGSRAMSGAGALTAAGTPRLVSSRGMAGGGALTFAGTPRITGTRSLTGSGSLVVAGVPDIPGAVGLSVEGTLTLSGVAHLPPPPRPPGPLTLTLSTPTRGLSVTEASRGLTVSTPTRTLTVEEP